MCHGQVASHVVWMRLDGSYGTVEYMMVPDNSQYLSPQAPSP